MSPYMPHYVWPSLKELNLYFNIMNVKLCLLNQEMRAIKMPFGCVISCVFIKENLNESCVNKWKLHSCVHTYEPRLRSFFFYFCSCFVLQMTNKWQEIPDTTCQYNLHKLDNNGPNITFLHRLKLLLLHCNLPIISAIFKLKPNLSWFEKE